MFAKLKDLSCAELQDIWKGLGISNFSDNAWYDESEGITMLDRAQEIFIELSRRGLPTVRKDGER